MKKILLTIALVVTACNLAAGVAYAAVCQSSSGVRVCGDHCYATAEGLCACDGACTGDEMQWVGGGGKKGVIAGEEFAY